MYAVIASLVVFGVAEGAASGSLLEAVLALYCSNVSEKGRPGGFFFVMRVKSSVSSCNRAVPVARASGITNARMSGDNGRLSSAIVEKRGFFASLLGESHREAEVCKLLLYG